MEQPLSGLKTDLNWRVQGRIIPGSCTGGGSILHLQVRYKDWLDDHYHYSHSPIPEGLAVEVAMAALAPLTPKLIAPSLDEGEAGTGVVFVHMVKLIQPPHSLGFLTVTGLTAILQVNGLETLCAASKDCEYCEI